MGPPSWGLLSGPPVNALRWCRGKPCLPRGLLAGALGSPAPTAVHPGPSAGILVPMTGSAGRGVGGLDNIFPRLPNVLAAIPDPMTGDPSVAGQGGRYLFCEWCRRWGCHDRVGRWRRGRVNGMREQWLGSRGDSTRYRRVGGRYSYLI